MANIEATELTTLDVHPDGTHVRVNVRDQHGLPASIVLPAGCANQLMRVLPRIVETAMRNSSKNDALRLVHPLECFFIEAGETDEEGAHQFILTLDTGKGFWISFTVADDILKTLGKTIVSDLIGNDQSEAHHTTH